MAENIQKPKKKRIGAPKSRRGCVTCKARHKKCDELKPACTPCTTTGRTCDFLHPASITQTALPRRPAATKKKSFLPCSERPLPLLVPAPTYGTPFSSQELPHFEYFRDLITNYTYSPFNSGTFQTLVLQLSHQENCIRNAIIAISVLLKYQARKHHADNPNVKNFKVESHIFFAKALEALNKRIGDGFEEGKWEVANLGSILFATFELLGGSEESAGKNLMTGTEMLRLRMSPGQRPSPTILALSQAFTHFNLQITTIDTFYSDPFTPLPLIPSQFDDLFQARDVLDNITAYQSSIFKPVKPYTQTLPYYPLLPHILTPYLIIQDLLSQWHLRFEELAKRLDVNRKRDRGTESGIKILRMTFLTADITLQTLFYADELAYDTFLPTFRIIVDLAESILFPPSTSSPPSNPAYSTPRSTFESLHTPPLPRQNPSFTFQALLIPPLYFGGLKCRNEVVRKRVIFLLGNCGVEGIWIGKAMRGVVGWVFDLENQHHSPTSSQLSPQISTSPPPSLSLSQPTTATGSTLGTSPPKIRTFTIRRSSRTTFNIPSPPPPIPPSFTSSPPKLSNLNLDDGNGHRNGHGKGTGDAFIPENNRIKSLKVSIEKSTRRAFVVTRRLLPLPESFAAVDYGRVSYPDQALPREEWEYLSGIIRWNDDDEVSLGGSLGDNTWRGVLDPALSSVPKNEGLSKEDIERGERILRDMMAVYRGAWERLDRGEDGKGLDVGGEVSAGWEEGLGMMGEDVIEGIGMLEEPGW